MTQEKNKFDAEIGKVLQLMIHSIYTNKEIFMRELISNSSDACDKLRYISQTEGNLIADDPELKIYIKINKDAKTISIRDNGIGMNKEDLKVLGECLDDLKAVTCSKEIKEAKEVREGNFKVEFS